VESPLSPEQGICADPLFRDPSSGDFRLLPGSPCSRSVTASGKTIGAYDVN